MAVFSYQTVNLYLAIKAEIARNSNIFVHLFDQRVYSLGRLDSTS
jgi:hypothetical protein